MPRDAVIVEAVRTPIGRRGGALKDVGPDDLAAFVLREIVDRSRIDPAAVDDVILGCVTQIDEQGLNIARIAALVAGFPVTVPGTSVNRQCGSGQQAVNFGAAAIMAGVAHPLVARGGGKHKRGPPGAPAGGPPAAPPPACRSKGTSPAGTPPGITDGAPPLLLTPPEPAGNPGLPPRAGMAGWGGGGVAPVVMLEAPPPPSRLVLRKAGLTVDDI